MAIVVVIIKAKTREDLNATVDPDDLRSLERRHGRVPSGKLVCKNLGGRTGFSVEATDWLLRHRNPVDTPVDTVSLDLETVRRTSHRDREHASLSAVEDARDREHPPQSVRRANA